MATSPGTWTPFASLLSTIFNSSPAAYATTKCNGRLLSICHKNKTTSNNNLHILHNLYCSLWRLLLLIIMLFVSNIIDCPAINYMHGVSLLSGSQTGPECQIRSIFISCARRQNKNMQIKLYKTIFATDSCICTCCLQTASKSDSSYLQRLALY